MVGGYISSWDMGDETLPLAATDTVCGRADS